MLSYLRVYKGAGVVVALNMSNMPQKIKLDLAHDGFASAKSVLATGKPAAEGNEIPLEPYGVFIGELSK